MSCFSGPWQWSSASTCTLLHCNCQPGAGPRQRHRVMSGQASVMLTVNNGLEILDSPLAIADDCSECDCLTASPLNEWDCARSSSMETSEANVVLLWCVWLPAGEWSVLVTVWLTKKFIHNFYTVYDIFFFYGVDVNSMFHSFCMARYSSFIISSELLQLAPPRCREWLCDSLLASPSSWHEAKMPRSSLLYIRNRSVHHASEIAANEKSKYLNYV